MYPAPRLFIITERSENIGPIQDVLDEKAPNWRSGRAFVVSANNQDVSIQGGALCVAGIKVELMDQVVFTKDASRQADALSRARDLGYSMRLVNARALRNWSRDGVLEHVLRASMLTSVQLLANKVAPYLHAAGAEAMANRIRIWHEQWRGLGEEELGFALLDVLRFHDTVEICGLIAPKNRQEHEDASAGNLIYCTMTGMETSAGPIARCFRNFVQQKVGQTLGQISRLTDLPEKVIVLDDGLWSGFDAMKQIDIAMKAPTQAFMRAQVELRFAMRTDLGEAALTSYLREKGYENFSICEASAPIEVLSVAGKKASADGQINHKNVKECALNDAWVEPQAFALLRKRGIKAESLRKLEELCRSLIAANTTRGGGYIYGNRLGTNNIAGVTAYGHGVPMSLLPCYRAKGKVQKPGGGGKLEWIPLFEIGKGNEKENMAPLAIDTE